MGKSAKQIEEEKAVQVNETTTDIPVVEEPIFSPPPKEPNVIAIDTGAIKRVEDAQMSTVETTTVKDEMPPQEQPQLFIKPPCKSKACQFYDNTMPYVNVAMSIVLVVLLLALVYFVVSRARSMAAMPALLPA